MKSARDFLTHMGTSIFHGTGLTPDQYLKEMNRFEVAFSKMQNREYEEAITGFLKVCESNKIHTQSYGNLGLCHAYLGRKQEALSAFNRALEIDPDYEPADINREIFLNLRDGEEMPHVTKTIEYYRELSRLLEDSR